MTATEPEIEEESSPEGRGQSSAPWVVATFVLAITTIGAGAWAVNANRTAEELRNQNASLEFEVTSLESQLDDLRTTAKQSVPK